LRDTCCVCLWVYGKARAIIYLIILKKDREMLLSLTEESLVGFNSTYDLETVI